MAQGRYGIFLLISLWLSVLLRASLCKFLIFSYTEDHRGSTEAHRVNNLSNFAG